MANFQRVIEWLKQKKKVRRPSWEEDSYWMLGVDESIQWNGERIAHIHLDQINAKDWEIYEEIDEIKVGRTYKTKEGYIYIHDITYSFGGNKRIINVVTSDICMFETDSKTSVLRKVYSEKEFRDLIEEPQALKESKPEFTENQLATIGQIQKLLQGFGCNTEVKLEGRCPFGIEINTCIHKYSEGCLHNKLYNILKKHGRR